MHLEPIPEQNDEIIESVQLRNKFLSHIAKELNWIATIPMSCLRGLVESSAFRELRKTVMNLYPYLM
jgi:hypothetical protein